MFDTAKDAMTARAAQAFINMRIGRYGRITGLTLDSRQKTVDVTCELTGEREPIGIRVLGYEVLAEEGRKFVRVTRCSATRPWLDHLLNDHLCGRRLELPAWAASAL
jgi:hypothetical protein